MDNTNTQELKQWLEANKTEEGKVRNEEIVDHLNANLEASHGDNIDLIFSYYDRDYLKKKEKTGPELSQLAHYYNQSVKIKPQDPQSKQQFQGRVQNLLDISHKKEPMLNEANIGYHQLFDLCAQEIANKRDTEKKEFIQSFFEDFPKAAQDNFGAESPEELATLIQSKTLHSLIERDLNDIDESAAQNNFGAESLKELKNHGFLLYKHKSRLMRKAMSSRMEQIESSDSEQVQQQENDVVDLLIQEGNDVNHLTLMNAVESGKSKQTLKKLLDHFSKESNINRTIDQRNEDGEKEELHLLDYLIERKDFNSMETLQPFFDKGMHVPENKKGQIAVKSMKAQKYSGFIDDLVSLSPSLGRYTDEAVPLHDMTSVFDFCERIQGFVEAEYHDPSIIQVLEQHDMLYHEEMKKQQKTKRILTNQHFFNQKCKKLKV